MSNTPGSLIAIDTKFDTASGDASGIQNAEADSRVGGATPEWGLRPRSGDRAPSNAIDYHIRTHAEAYVSAPSRVHERHEEFFLRS
jgi:hypothetical protein